VMVGTKSGRFSYKQERELISMAASGATVSQIAARFRTTAVTIERKAKRLGISVRKVERSLEKKLLASSALGNRPIKFGLDSNRFRFDDAAIDF
jgi:hypothetical protein